MADSSITILDSTSTPRAVDAQTLANGDYQQTLTIGDGVNQGRVASITAGTALQVNMAQSGGVVAPVTQALTATGASTLAGSGSTTGSAVIDVSMSGNASFHLLATAFVGTVVFEQTFDPAGTNGTWAPVPCIPEDALNAPMSTLSINTAVAYIRQFTQGMFGPALFRVRVTAFTSGSLTAYLKAGPGWYEGQPALAPSNSNIGIVSVNPAAAITVGTGTGTTPATAGQVGRVVRANANVAQATAATLIAAPAAGTRIYVTNISCGNEGATFSVARLFAGTLPAAAGAVAVVNDVWDFPMAASGGGAGVNFPPHAPWCLPVATALSFAVTVATTWNISVSYYVA